MTDWRMDASCREFPTELFFAEGRGSSGDYKSVVEMVCAGCCVADQCLESALWEEQDNAWMRHGIRGGLTPVQREKHWAALLARGAGWCRRGLHIMEREETSCRQCQMERKAG